MSAHAYRASLARKIEKTLDNEETFLVPGDPLANPFAEGRRDALLEMLMWIKELDT